jgi:hypothetical protein
MRSVQKSSMLRLILTSAIALTAFSCTKRRHAATPPESPATISAAYPQNQRIDVANPTVDHPQASCPAIEGFEANACKIELLGGKVLEQLQEITEKASSAGVFRTVAGDGDIKLDKVTLARTEWSDLNLTMDARATIVSPTSTSGNDSGFPNPLSGSNPANNRAQVAMTYKGFWADYQFAFYFRDTKTGQTFTRSIPRSYRFFPFFSIAAQQNLSLSLDKLVGVGAKIPPQLVDALLGLNISFEFNAGFTYHVTNLLNSDFTTRDKKGFSNFQYDYVTHVLSTLCQDFTKSRGIPATVATGEGPAAACNFAGFQRAKDLTRAEEVGSVVNGEFKLMKAAKCTDKDRRSGLVPLYDITFKSHDLWRLEPGQKLYLYSLNTKTKAEWLRVSGSNNWLTVRDISVPAKECGADSSKGELCVSAEIARNFFEQECKTINEGQASAADILADKEVKPWLGVSPIDEETSISWRSPELQVK